MQVQKISIIKKKLSIKPIVVSLSDLELWDEKARILRRILEITDMCAHREYHNKTLYCCHVYALSYECVFCFYHFTIQQDFITPLIIETESHFDETVRTATAMRRSAEKAQRGDRVREVASHSDSTHNRLSSLYGIDRAVLCLHYVSTFLSLKRVSLCISGIVPQLTL